VGGRRLPPPAQADAAVVRNSVKTAKAETALPVTDL